MIVFYGSNGMSEAPFIFFMSWAVRRLIMWMLDDDVHHLIVAGGIAMGLAYLTRYDAVACIAAAGLLVGVTTYLRARPAPRFRRALLDLLMVSGPGFAAFIGWAAVSWLITGQAFAQFTSQYGNTAILEQSGQTKPDFGAGLVFAAVCISLLAPTLVPIAVWGTVRRWRRPNWQLLLVPVTISVPHWPFRPTVTHPGRRFPSCGSTSSRSRSARAWPCWRFPRANSSPPHAEAITRRRSNRLTSCAGAGRPICRWRRLSRSRCLSPRGGWASRSMHRRNTPWVRCWYPTRQRQCAKALEHRIAATFSTEREIAHYLEKLDLPESSVITDTVYGFAIVAASGHPKTFVVPSDPDFTALSTLPPRRNQVSVAVPPTGRGMSDALNLRYPTLYETGADIATLELEIPNDGDSQPNWRLYRVNEPLAPR